MKTKVEVLKEIATKITNVNDEIKADTISEVLEYINDNFSLKNEVSKSIDVEYIDNPMNTDIAHDTEDHDLIKLSKQLAYIVNKFSFLILELYADKGTGVIVNGGSPSAGSGNVYVFPKTHYNSFYAYLIEGDAPQISYLAIALNNNVLSVRIGDDNNSDNYFTWIYNVDTGVLTKQHGFDGTSYVLENAVYTFETIGGMLSNATVKNVKVR